MQGGFHIETSALENPAIRSVWHAWNELSLPDCWLVAGCLAQTVWNERFGFAPDYGISDIDLVYFDASDLTEAGETAQAERVRELFPDLGVWIDVKNEARVHLWYKAKFGYSITPYSSTINAIDTFPTTATTVGIRPKSSGAEVYSTFDLNDLFSGVVRANKRQITRAIYEAKVSKWLARWPDLEVVSWDQA